MSNANVNFNDESDVKQFLSNIGIEYRFGCYSEKNPEGKILTHLYPKNVYQQFYESKCF